MSLPDPIRTERLILRLPQESDLDPMHRFGQSPRSRFVGGSPERSDAWRKLLATIGHWTLRGFGWFTLVETASGRVAGRSGTSLHEGYPETELGWHLYDGFEGRGYATEAARAIRGWYAQAISPAPLMSMIDPDNHASAAVARRLGATVERRDVIDGHVVDIWRHPGAAA